MSGLVGMFLFSGACNPPLPEFDGQNAFLYLEQQCAFGPRNPGSSGHRECRAYLTRTLSARADTFLVQPFEYHDATIGKTYQLTNLIARFNTDAERQILIGAHWDTRPWADQDPDTARRREPILGANDGASGVAVLLELARLMQNQPPPLGITLVLFDGEDLGQAGAPRSYAQGAQYFARHLSGERPEYAIVIDMVGDAELDLPMERHSYRQNPALVKSLWALARELNLPAFKQRLEDLIYDDHVPLWEEGQIPAVDIIDFNYPNRIQNFWHTHQDLPRHCSPQSLEQVGTLLVHHIYNQTGGGKKTRGVK